MGTSNENKIVGMVPRVLALAVALVIVYSVTAPFVTAVAAIEAGFKQGGIAPSALVMALRTK